MIYEKHNSIKNFTRAGKASDSNAQRDIAMSGLANAIVYNKEGVILEIQKSGIKIPDDASQKAIINVISKNMAKNNLLRKNIASLIIGKKGRKHNGLPFLNASSSSTDWQSWANTAATLANAFGNKNKGGQNQQPYQQPQQQLQTYVGGIQNRPPTGISTGAIIGIVAGVVVISSLVIILATRK